MMLTCKLLSKNKKLNPSECLVIGDDPEPSDEGYQITEIMTKAGKLLGILVLDHVVIGDKRFYSFSEEGEI